MAKRAPADQKPFNALDKGLAASVMNSTGASSTAVAEAPPVRPVAPPIVEREAAQPDAPAPDDAPTLAPARTVPAVTARQPVLSPKSTAEDHSPKEKLSREKRVLLTPSEEREIERCVDRIAEGFGGTPVKLSHLVRACLTVLRHSEAEVIRRAQDVGQLTRPPNGDVMALAEFEHELAKVLSQAFRDAPALR